MMRIEIDATGKIMITQTPLQPSAFVIDGVIVAPEVLVNFVNPNPEVFIQGKREGTTVLYTQVQAGSGTLRIAAERTTQLTEEAWTAAHDDAHTQGEMMSAAADYISEAKRLLRGHEPILDERHLPFGWPWDKSWWKPSPDPICNLTKAGALIAAEIDRLQRFAPVKAEQYTAQEYLDALDILSSAVRYLRLQYSGGMARPIAKAHFEARAILINASSALLDESEAIFKHHAETR